MDSRVVGNSTADSTTVATPKHLERVTRCARRLDSRVVGKATDPLATATTTTTQIFINDHLERVESSLEKVFLLLIFLLVLEHVVVVGVVVVVVHRAVRVDEEQGGCRRGGEGYGGRPG